MLCSREFILFESLDFVEKVTDSIIGSRRFYGYSSKFLDIIVEKKT